MAHHTPEPWRVADTEIAAGEFSFVANCCPPYSQYDRPEYRANAARIVACVNALAGVSDADLDRMTPDIFADMVAGWLAAEDYRLSEEAKEGGQ